MLFRDSHWAIHNRPPIRIRVPCSANQLCTYVWPSACLHLFTGGDKVLRGFDLPLPCSEIWRNDWAAARAHKPFTGYDLFRLILAHEAPSDQAWMRPAPNLNGLAMHCAGIAVHTAVACSISSSADKHRGKQHFFTALLLFSRVMVAPSSIVASIGRANPL